MNLISMIFDVPLDQICRNFISHRPCKIPILPKFSPPKLLPHFRISIKYLACRNTLQHPHHPRNRVPRRKTQKYMNMVQHYSHLLNIKTIVLCNFKNYLPRLISDIFSLNPFPILRRPYQMIFGVVNSVSSSSDTHVVSYTTFFCFQQTHLSSPSTGRGFQVRF